MANRKAQINQNDSKESREFSDDSSVNEDNTLTLNDDTKSRKTNQSKKSGISKATTIVPKKSVSTVENINQIFLKTVDDRDKSEKDKIFQYLRLGVNFFRDI